MKNMHMGANNTSLPAVSSAQPPQGQPQMGGRPQGTSDLRQRLAKYSLPSGTVTDADMSKIKVAIDDTCNELNEAIKSAGQKVDNEVIKVGILGFQDWLKRQGCVSKASSRYEIESTDKYASQIFETSPGTLAFDIDFKMDGNTKKTYRLLLFVSKVDLFAMASLVENKSLAGVPVPKGWPKNPWSYWTNRP